MSRIWFCLDAVFRLYGFLGHVSNFSNDTKGFLLSIHNLMLWKFLIIWWCHHKIILQWKEWCNTPNLKILQKTPTHRQTNIERDRLHMWENIFVQMLHPAFLKYFWYVLWYFIYTHLYKTMFLNSRPHSVAKNSFICLTEDRGHTEVSQWSDIQKSALLNTGHEVESNHQLSTVSLESKPKPHGTISLLWIKTSAQSHTLHFALNPHTHRAKMASAQRRVWQRWGGVAAVGVSRKTSGCLRAPTTRNGRGEVSTRLTGLTQCFVSSSYGRSLSRSFRRVNVSKRSRAACE